MRFSRDKKGIAFAIENKKENIIRIAFISREFYFSECLQTLQRGTMHELSPLAYKRDMSENDIEFLYLRINAKDCVRKWIASTSEILKKEMLEWEKPKPENFRKEKKVTNPNTIMKLALREYLERHGLPEKQMTII